MNGRSKTGWALSVVMAVAAATLLSGLSARTAHAAGLLLADNGFGGALVVKQQDVRVVMNNGIAVTEVEQVFLNTENRVVEALYTFPVPKNASVSNFSMWINGKEMIGEVVEKKRREKSTKATRLYVATPACWSKWITNGLRCGSFPFRRARSSE